MGLRHLTKSFIQQRNEMEKGYMVVKLRPSKTTFELGKPEIFPALKNAMFQVKESCKKDPKSVYAIQEVYYDPKVIG